MTGALMSEVVDATFDEDLGFLDFAYARGWTDGLPVVAPTPERVRRMLSAIDLDAAECVGRLSPRGGEATAERIAVNAVMAGCEPAYMPVLVAAVTILARPEAQLGSVQATTSPATPLLVVNGPIRNAIGMNSGRGCLGPGNRANATIGRAIRLMLQNIGGGVPDEVDKSTQGLPAKFSLCFAENEEASPWPSLSLERGDSADRSTVTMTTIISISNVRLPDPRPATIRNEIAILGDALAQRGTKHVQTGSGNPVVVLSPGTATIFARAGFSKAGLKEALYESARRPAAGYEAQPLTHYRVVDGMVVPCERADDIVLVVAGGPEPNQSLVMSSFCDTPVITETIEVTGAMQRPGKP